MTQTQTQKLFRIECPPECGFIVQSHDEREVLRIGRDHAYAAHDSDVTARDLRPYLK